MDDRFKYVFHIDGTSTATVNQSYAKICQQNCEGYRQGGSMARGTIEEMKALALGWIEGLVDEWLMIYDNHPEKDRLQPVLPRRNTGNIIYTCRSQGPATDLPAECSCEVKPFAEADAVNLLLRVAGREHLGSDEEEMKSAQKMVAEVGYLPLAIDSIGAYLRNGDCSAITYLQRFRDHRIRSGLFSSAQNNKDGSLPARPGLYTALDLSYDAIAGVRRREGSSAVGMAAACALRALNLLCFYHNEEIPFSMIGRAAEQRLSFGAHGMYPLADLADDPFMDVSYLLDCHIPEGIWDSLAFRLGVQMLQQFSLVKLSPARNTISMHVLIQTWARDRMDDKTRGRQALAARIVLIESIKLGWNRFDQVLSRNLTPHFDTCMAHEHEDVTLDEYQAHLNFKLGWFYKEDKQFFRAVESLEDAVRMWKASTGAHSSSTTVGLTMLANVYHDMGRLGDAEATYLEVLDRSWIRNHLTVEEHKARKAREERRLARRALRQQLARLHTLSSPELRGEKAGGRMSLDKAAMAEDGEGSLPPAVPPSSGTDETGTDIVAQWHQDVLAVVDNEPQQETAREWQHEVAAVYADLARLFFDEGRHELGRWCLSQAIERAKSDGSYDMEIRAWEDELKQHSGVVDLDYWNRRIAAVDGFSREDRDIYLGHDYSFVLPMGFASALVEKDNWETAYKIYEGIFQRATRFYGHGDRKTLDLMRLMAFCQTQRGLVDEAEELARTAVERSKASYGRWHFQTAKCLEVLAYVLARTSLDAGEESEWRKATREAYEAMRFAFGEDHDDTKELKRSLGALGGDVQERELGGEGDKLFAEIFARVLAKGVPKSMDEYEERADKEYRELWIERCQAESTMKEAGGGQIGQQQGTERGPALRAGDNQELRSAVVGDERPRVSRRKDKWKSKEKASIPLSPIQEVESSFEETTQGLGVAETLSEHPESCSSGGTWRLLHEFRLGADWNTPAKPWIRIWKSDGPDGALMFTGAIVGDGEPRWRRLRPWDDFQALLTPHTIEAGDGDSEL
jgi:tetratricopeptide (TPR) repeat protein